MIEMHVPDVSCGHCVQAVQTAIAECDPQARVRVDLGTRQVVIESTRSEQELVHALTEAGYPPAPGI